MFETLPLGMLVGRGGPDGEVISIASGRTFRVKVTGVLYLGINDRIYDSDAGALEVAVKRQR
jgi:hypothetical protein